MHDSLYQHDTSHPLLADLGNAAQYYSYSDLTLTKETKNYVAINIIKSTLGYYNKTLMIVSYTA